MSTRYSSNHLPEAKGTCLNSVEPFLTWTAHRAIGITNKTLGGSQKSGESRFYGKRNLFHKKTSLAEKSERVSQSDKYMQDRTFEPAALREALHWSC